jgi:predicted cupin superfamily sugar epimerase
VKHPDAAQIIAALGLQRLPREGGWFKPTWRTEAGSAIYYLITPDDFSALHRLRRDEIWHFHAGDPIEHIQLDSRDRRARMTRLGPNVLRGDVPQLVVPAGVWQGARLTAQLSGWALLGCTLAPPWDERDFELGDGQALVREFPEHAGLVRALVR